MAFASSDPLSELVWSPHNGLSVKRANLSLDDKRPLLVWNIDPSSSSCSASDGKDVIIDADDKFGYKATFVEISRGGPDRNEDKMEEKARNRDAIQKDDEEENLCRIKNDGLSTLLDGIRDSEVDMAINGQFSTDLTKKTHCNKSSNDIVGLDVVHPEARFYSLPSLKSQKEIEDEVTSAMEDSPPAERSPMNSAICLYREKGKAKVLADGDNRSVESSNSARLLHKGVKRKRSNDREMLNERRMVKRESPGSISGTRYRSSFMNWISNMVKGLSDSYNEDTLDREMLDETHDSSSLNMGFQTVFRSLYCRTTKMSRTGLEKESGTNKTPFESTPRLSQTNNDNSCKEIVESTKESHCLEMALIPLETSNMLEKSNPPASLLVTRFFTVDPTVGNSVDFRKVNLDRRVDNVEGSIDFKSSKKLEGLEAMATVFARNGHNLRERPKVTKTELEDLIVKREMFDAIRKLLFTRADILRWINSNISLSRLNGFFVRLRLGNPKAGTSYYVAWITGETRERIGCLSEKSISVDVGGIKSFVGIEYVSNHDFMEDEIKAWWCTVVKSGRNIPSLHELSAKLNDRNELGF